MSDLLWPDANAPRPSRLRGRMGKLRLRPTASDPDTGARQSQIVAGMVAEQPIERRHIAPALIVCGWIVVILLGFLSRMNFGLDGDELRHLDMSWRIGRGEIPYRDFRQTHPPLFHYLLGPFVSDYTHVADAPLLPLRLCEAGVQLLLLLGGYSVLRRLLPRSAAAWGAGLFLVTSMFSHALYDIRPDWLALFCIVGVVWSISERPSRAIDLTDARRFRRAAFAGALAGFAAMLTENSWLLLVGIIIWYAASSSVAESPEDRRGRRIRFFAFLTALFATCGGVIGYLAINGAAKSFFNANLTMLLKAPHDLTFVGFIRSTAPYSAGVLSLAVLAMVALARNWREEFATAGSRGLLGVVALFGAIAFVAMPGADEDRFIFLVLFWSALLAADFAWRIIVEPQNWKSAPKWIAAIVLLLAISQTTVMSGAVVAIAWLTMLAMVTYCCVLSVRSGRPHFRILSIGIAVTAAGLMLTLASNVTGLRVDHSGQLRVSKPIDRAAMQIVRLVID